MSRRYTKTYICDWRDRHTHVAQLVRYIEGWLSGKGPPVVLPLQTLVYPLSPRMLLTIHQTHAMRLVKERTASTDADSAAVGRQADHGAIRE